MKLTDWGSIAADPRTLATSRKGLFAGGDVVTGPNTVVNAIASGKKAAVMIDRYLSGEDQRLPGDGARSGSYPDPAPARRNPAGAGRGERLTVPHVPASERRGGFAEVEQVVTQQIAQREAARCLRCDLDSEGAASAKTARDAQSLGAKCHK